MANQIVNEEFEVSFDYRKVLYVCQVLLTGEPENPYYKVKYFSPNGKGEINKLVVQVPKDGTDHIHWTAPGENQDPEFLQVLGNMIQKKVM